MYKWGPDGHIKERDTPTHTQNLLCLPTHLTSKCTISLWCK
jgi:hypothetical protein